MKRLFDFSAALLGLVLLLPLFAFIALAIKLDSKGPVFFRQKRMGQGGTIFHIFKFRTMTSDAEADGCAITVWNDPRITRVGRFLRRYRVDELPQLINVLSGDMSLVGPRPELPKYRRYYADSFRAVLDVRPGITDPATLHFRDEAALLRGQANPEAYYLREILPKKLKLNLNYLGRSNFRKDIRLILKTLRISFSPALRAFIQSYMEVITSMALHLQFTGHLAHLKSSRRRFMKIVLDAGLIVLAYFWAFLIRFDGAIPASELRLFVQSAPLLLFVSLVSFYKFKLYKGLYEYSSIKDLLLLITTHSFGWSLFIGLQYLFHVNWTPRSVLVIYWLLGLILMGGVRFSYRLVFEISGLRQGDRTRVLIVGAGTVGEMIIRQMKIDTKLGYQPACLVDDDPEKIDVRIHGVPVMGTTSDIPALTKRERISQIVIATQSASPTQMRHIVAQCEKAGVVFKTVPGPREMINGDVNLEQLRGVRIEDLLDREAVHSDSERIASFLNGKVVLVTGAGGSIGQELCRQIMQYKPQKVIMFDRNENSLFYLENDLRERWAGGYHAAVGDVCDPMKVAQVVQHHRPSVIFHAAAHKHVPLMESNPEEAIKNNLKGTMTVASVAKECGVSRFVLISTDKAVEPVNIMGASKRLAELYIQGANEAGGTKFMTVRFGNVLGSNGSVFTLFQKQIARRKPITITDPEMTRYFMTISEAVTLILQASTLGEGGEIFVLDMGEPVKVVEMARHLISMSGLVPDQDILIQYTGKRPGEKVFERLWQEGESPQRTEYEKILVARANGHNHWNLLNQLNDILDLAHSMQRDAMIAKISEVIPSYHPSESSTLVY